MGRVKDDMEEKYILRRSHLNGQENVDDIEILQNVLIRSSLII